jgi:hypothetical protein
VGSYATGQDPATVLFAAPLPGSPSTGSAGEALKFADTRLDATLSAIKAKTDLIVSLDLAGTVNDNNPTTLSFMGSSCLSTTDNLYVGAYLAFTGGVLQGISRRISGYTGATRLFSFATPLSVAPSNGDPFVILSGN